MLRKATSAGTVTARTFEDQDNSIGIVLGIHDKPNMVTLECSENKLRILIADKIIEENNVEIVHVPEF